MDNCSLVPQLTDKRWHPTICRSQLVKTSQDGCVEVSVQVSMFVSPIPDLLSKLQLINQLELMARLFLKVENGFAWNVSKRQYMWKDKQLESEYQKITPQCVDLFNKVDDFLAARNKNHTRYATWQNEGIPWRPPSMKGRCDLLIQWLKSV